MLAPLVLLCFLLWYRELTRVFNFSVSTVVQIPILYKGTQMFLDSVHFPLLVVDILIFSNPFYKDYIHTGTISPNEVNKIFGGIATHRVIDCRYTGVGISSHASCQWDDNTVEGFCDWLEVSLLTVGILLLCVYVCMYVCVCVCARVHACVLQAAGSEVVIVSLYIPQT